LGAAIVPTSSDDFAPASRDARAQRPVALLRQQMRAETAATAVPRQPAPPPRPARKFLARPPCINVSQLARAGVLVLLGLAYAEHPRISHAFQGGARGVRRAIARVGVDPMPTGALTPKAIMSTAARVNH
jgi:hypothetical protein